MIGILIIAHGSLGQSLVECASHMLGARPERLAELRVDSQEDPAHAVLRGRRLVRELDDGDGVLVLTDVYGATPSNIAAQILEPGHVAGLSGVSLPMLVRALTYRNQTLDAVAAKAASGGVEGVYRMPPAPAHAAARS